MAKALQVITDEQRINALESGFCINCEDTRAPDGGWIRIWYVAFGPMVATGDTLREAMDRAIEARDANRH